MWKLFILAGLGLTWKVWGVSVCKESDSNWDAAVCCQTVRKLRPESHSGTLRKCRLLSDHRRIKEPTRCCFPSARTIYHKGTLDILHDHKSDAITSSVICVVWEKLGLSTLVLRSSFHECKRIMPGGFQQMWPGAHLRVRRHSGNVWLWLWIIHACCWVEFESGK